MKAKTVLSALLALSLILLASLAAGCGGGDKPQAGKAAGPARTAGVWVTNNDLMKTAVYRIDPNTNKVVATIELDGLSKGIAADGTSVWLTDFGNGKVWRIDAATNKIVATVKVGEAPTAVAVGHGSVWVANSTKGNLSRIDPATNKVTATIPITNSLLNSICILDNAVWVASVDMTVSRVDPATNAVTGKIRVTTNPSGISGGFGSLWVGDPMGKKVLRLDPAALKPAASIKTGNTQNTACADGFVAAANYAEGSVVFIDPKENKVTGEVKTGKSQTAIALGHGALWTSSSQENMVYRIDQTSKAVTAISVAKPGKIVVTQ
jgi:YVTN family beta-propeller protein